jgi:hypothetical protein
MLIPSLFRFFLPTVSCAVFTSAPFHEPDHNERYYGLA